MTRIHGASWLTSNSSSISVFNHCHQQKACTKETNLFVIGNCWIASTVLPYTGRKSETRLGAAAYKSSSLDSFSMRGHLQYTSAENTCDPRAFRIGVAAIDSASFFKSLLTLRDLARGQPIQWCRWGLEDTRPPSQSVSDFKLTADGYMAACTLLCILCPRCNCTYTALLLAGRLVTYVGGLMYPACNCCVSSAVSTGPVV